VRIEADSIEHAQAIVAGIGGKSGVFWKSEIAIVKKRAVLEITVETKKAVPPTVSALDTKEDVAPTEMEIHQLLSSLAIRHVVKLEQTDIVRLPPSIPRTNIWARMPSDQVSQLAKNLDDFPFVEILVKRNAPQVLATTFTSLDGTTSFVFPQVDVPIEQIQSNIGEDRIKHLLLNAHYMEVAVPVQFFWDWMDPSKADGLLATVPGGWNQTFARQWTAAMELFFGPFAPSADKSAQEITLQCPTLVLMSEQDKVVEQIMEWLAATFLRIPLFDVLMLTQSDSSSSSSRASSARSFPPISKWAKKINIEFRFRLWHQITGEKREWRDDVLVLRRSWTNPNPNPNAK
jgi:hypothetical protein